MLAVLDISDAALNVARQRLGTQATDIEWYETDVSEFRAPHPFSLWHDRAVFHFLVSAEDRQHYVEVLKRTLIPNGQVIIAAFALDDPTCCMWA